jgi:hypothetical protein
VCLDPAALAARQPLQSAPGTAAASTWSAADSSKVLIHASTLSGVHLPVSFAK